MDIQDPEVQQVLDLISRHCPYAMGTYLQCVNRGDSKGEMLFSKDVVEVEMSNDWRKFKKDIKALARENLLYWSPLNDGIAVCMAMKHD